MKYELDTFLEIIQGSMRPEITTNASTQYLTYLQQYGDYGIAHYKASFQKQSAKSYKLTSLHTYHALEACPLDEEITSGKQDECTRDLLEAFRQEIYLPPAQLSTAIAYADRDHISLNVTGQIDYREMSFRQLRFYYYDQLARNEWLRVQQVLKKEVFTLASEEAIRLYVQNHQRELENLSQLVLDRIPAEERQRIYLLSDSHTLTDIYKTLYKYLEMLLSYLERHFTRYLDMTSPVPYRCRVISSLEFADKTCVIMEKLEKAGISQSLLDLVSVPLTKMLLLKEESMSYQQLMYHRKFLLECHRTLTKQENQIDEAQIICLLHEVNYNSLKFFSFLTDKVSEHVNEKEHLMDKLEVLYNYLRRYHQFNSKTHLKYCNLPAIRQQMIDWLDEEINFYIKKMTLENSLPLVESTAKLKTKLSVAQLAYFFRLQHDVGIISSKNQRDFLRKVSSQISTDRIENISFGSLSSKYYNVDSATKQAVKKVLTEMLESIDSK